jgi:hypothetical protein
MSKSETDKSTYRPFLHIADLVNPNSGKTYREENTEKEHIIPIGSLVELKSGVRLFVVFHERDCDGTPLYCLAIDSTDTIQEHPSFLNRKWHGGYSEESLKVIK